MNEDRQSSRWKLEEQLPHRNSDGEFQYLLSAEQQLLQSISARAPLPELLNGICAALDCQIGNVVSNISLRDDDANEIAAIAGDATFFGLHVFCSAGIVAENGELLGSLDMYCCPLRRPSTSESPLIERATCLAGIAIQRHNESGDQGSSRVPGSLPVQQTSPDLPTFFN
jgi:hypothetical protein